MRKCSVIPYVILDVCIICFRFIKNPEMFRLLHGNKSDPCAHDPSEGHVTAAEMTYYSPEVIQGAPYTHKADVW